MEANSVSMSKLPNPHQPVRSISFPNRTNPSSQRVEALLNHLKSHHHHSQPLLEAEEIQSDLVLLAELYISMEELCNSPQTQQALLHYNDGKLVTDSLSGSVTLLDACESARELLLVLREQLQTLQSAIRRRRGDSSIENSIADFESFRKRSKKTISNQFKQMKLVQKQNRVTFSVLDQGNQQITLLARVLQEASNITISILRSVLLFLSMPALGTKGPSSLISKLKLFSIEKEQKNNINGVEDLNDALCSLIGREKNSDSSNGEGQRALRLLETLNVDIDGVEGGLDCIFRCLVKNRVLFLNMLAHRLA